MAVVAASLEAILSLDKSKFDKPLKETGQNLKKTEGAIEALDKASDKMGAAMSQATNRGRLGLSAIDQEANNAQGSLSNMLSALGGGAGAQAESVLAGISDNITRAGKTAISAGNNFEQAARSLGKGFDKISLDAKDFGEDAQKAFKKSAAGIDEIENALKQLGDEAENTGDDFGSITDSIGDLIPGLDKLKGLGDPAGILGALIGGGIALTSAAVGAMMEVSDATHLIQARTGATGKELEDLGDIAINVWRNNWGDSIADATDAMIQTRQVLGQTGQELQDTTIHALFFRDVMGIDIPESLRAVRSAQQQFGTEAEQTFDMMTALIQRVGDPYQDLADTINEYSADLAQAGFTQEEFFGILEAGVSKGARNFDVIADLVREFTIRIVDGSDTTENALNRLFATTGRGGQEFFELKQEIDNTAGALEANQEALEKSEGAYEAQAKVVDDLEGALSEARRELDELARPNLKGMEEFDDKLFELDQQAKRLQLALLDLDEDTPAFEDTRAQLEEVNREMDKLSLERELTIEPQLRAIEKAAMEGREPIVTYEQALADVAAKKEDIAELETAFNAQRDALIPLSQQYESIADENQRLLDLQDQLQTQLETMKTPAQEFLDTIASGDKSSRDAMSAIVQMLKEIEDQTVADQIAVDLFGTKAEELGLDILTSLDPAVNQMREFEGATRDAEAAVSSGLGPTWSTFWRNIKSEAIEAMESWGKWLSETAGKLGLSDKPLREALTAGSNLQGFQSGGMVPGPTGAPQLAVVHGGERVLTPEQQKGGGGITVIIQGNVYGDSHLEEIISENFSQLTMALSGT